MWGELKLPPYIEGAMGGAVGGLPPPKAPIGGPSQGSLRGHVGPELHQDLASHLQGTSKKQEVSNNAPLLPGS